MERVTIQSGRDVLRCTVCTPFDPGCTLHILRTTAFIPRLHLPVNHVPATPQSGETNY